MTVATTQASATGCRYLASFTPIQYIYIYSALLRQMGKRQVQIAVGNIFPSFNEEIFASLSRCKRFGMPTMLRFCRWDFKERVRWLGVHKGLKFQGIQVLRVPSDHARFGAPVLASHIVFQR